MLKSLNAPGLDQSHRYLNMFSTFTTLPRTYTLKVGKFVCNKFGIAEFFARSLTSLPATCKNVLDVGCGAGPLMIFLADQYGVQVTGVELNAEACRCCRENICKFGLSGISTIFEGEFSSFVQISADIRFDLIVSNPPLDETVTISDISYYNAKGFAYLDGDTFSYVTNSWHDGAGNDLLDLIFDYSVDHLTLNGMIVIAFCEISGARLPLIEIKAAKYGFQLFHSISSTISPADIGAETVTATDIVVHYAVLKRSFRHENQDS